MKIFKKSLHLLAFSSMLSLSMSTISYAYKAPKKANIYPTMKEWQIFISDKKLSLHYSEHKRKLYGLSDEELVPEIKMASAPNRNQKIFLPEQAVRNNIKNNPLNAKDDEKKISSSVHRVIQREMKNRYSIMKNFSQENLKDTVKTVVDSYQKKMGDKVTQSLSGLKKHQKKRIIDPFFSQEKFREKHKTESTIQVTKINIKKRTTTRINYFNFIPNYNQNSTWDDHGSGEIYFSHFYKNKHAMLNGALIGPDFIKVNINLGIEDKERTFNVFSFGRHEFESLLRKQKMRGLGGHVLIQLNEDIQDADLGESEYEGRIYFNERFKIVERIDKASFILFVGVTTGNALLSLQHISGSIAEKIILVVEDELFYDEGFLLKGQRELFSLWETNIFGHEESELNISGNLIKFFNKNIKAKNLALNHYEMDIPYIPYGTRKYYKLDHFSKNMFVGSFSNDDLYIPGRNFIVQIFNQLDIDELAGRCLIQVNLSFPPLKVEVDSKSGNGAIHFDHLFLDQKGTFSRSANPLTQKFFVIGEEQGVFDFKIEYLDGEVDYFQSYCSRDTYLIEQM